MKAKVTLHRTIEYTFNPNFYEKGISFQEMLENESKYFFFDLDGGDEIIESIITGELIEE